VLFKYEFKSWNLCKKRFDNSWLFFLSIITGQKPVSVHAKKPSALFKNRKNELLGWKVTLRNFKFNIFFDKFYLFVQSQESTEFKIKNLSSVIEFNKIVIPLNMEIHLIK
jgi:ribosomal protein L5